MSLNILVNEQGYQWAHKKDLCPPKTKKKQPTKQFGEFIFSKGSLLICCSEELQRKIESQLALCEFSMQKSVQVYKMNEDEQKNYEKLNKDIGSGISQRLQKRGHRLSFESYGTVTITRIQKSRKILHFYHFMVVEKQISQACSRISECKNELAQAKRIRKNRQGNRRLNFKSSVFKFGETKLFKYCGALTLTSLYMWRIMIDYNIFEEKNRKRKLFKTTEPQVHDSVGDSKNIRFSVCTQKSGT